MNELVIGYSISEFNSLSMKWQKFWKYLIELKKCFEESLANRNMKLCVAKKRTIKWIEFLFWPNIFEGIKWAEYLKIIKTEQEWIWKYNEAYTNIIKYIDYTIEKQFTHWRLYFEDLCIIINEKIKQIFWEWNWRLALFWEELWLQLSKIIIEKYEEDLCSRQRIEKLKEIIRRASKELIIEWRRRRKRTS